MSVELANAFVTHFYNTWDTNLDELTALYVRIVEDAHMVLLLCEFLMHMCTSIVFTYHSHHFLCSVKTVQSCMCLWLQVCSRVFWA
jgi:hypothetical protein